jgi:hypothetical protein
VTSPIQYNDDPERMRPQLARTVRGEWFVFETFAADGSLAVGIGRGTPDPTMQLVVYEGLSRTIAESAAEGLAQWYHDQSRDIRTG